MLRARCDAAQALHKYKQKRKNLCFTKKIRYESRKQLAQARPRVKGQFVRMTPNQAPAGGGEENAPAQAADAAEALLLAAAEKGDLQYEDTTAIGQEVCLSSLDILPHSASSCIGLVPLIFFAQQILG